MRAAIGFVERRLEHERHLELGRDRLQALGRRHHELLALDDTRAGDQEQRSLRADLETREPHALATRGSLSPWHERAAVMKLVNSGWPLRGFELNSGMELRGEEPRMNRGRQLDELDEPVTRETGELEAGLRELVEIAVVEFVSMTMALGDLVGAVDRFRERTVLDVAGLRAEPHRAAEIGRGAALLDRAVAILPLGDHRDDRMRRLLIQLGGMGAREARDVARVLDDGDLQPQADAQDTALSSRART